MESHLRDLLHFIGTHGMDLIDLILMVAATLSIGLVVFLLFTKKFQAKGLTICRGCYKPMSRDKSGNWVCKCGRGMEMNR